MGYSAYHGSSHAVPYVSMPLCLSVKAAHPFSQDYFASCFLGCYILMMAYIFLGCFQVVLLLMQHLIRALRWLAEDAGHLGSVLCFGTDFLHGLGKSWSDFSNTFFLWPIKWHIFRSKSQTPREQQEWAFACCPFMKYRVPTCDLCGCSWEIIA